MLDRRLMSASLVFCLAALGVTPLACGSSGNSNTSGDDGGAGDDGSGSGSSSGASGSSSGSGSGSSSGGNPTCAGDQQACTGDSDCCSNLCLGSVCQSSISTCAAAGGHCGVNTDCCSGACLNGACGSAQCVSIGDACPAAGTNTCCTDTCVNGKCAAIGAGADGGGGGGCTTSGNKCANNTDCCSGLCTNGTCNQASSFCLQNNEMCFVSSDCCGGTCSAPNGQPVSAGNPGLCTTPGAAVNCTAVDGVVCAGTTPGCPGPCCSDLCVPFGPTGVLICQPAQGCRVEGDLCQKDTDCCGGENADAGLVGSGLVVCTKTAPTDPIGRCSTASAGNGGGNTCRPPGEVCHYNGTGYNCSVSASSADCCDVGGHPNKDLCQLDKLGVPRCLAYSGTSDGGVGAPCRQTSQTCSTSSDCCDGSPCVPGPGGALVCSGVACVATSGACTSSADCCAGNTCVIPPGAASGTCFSSSGGGSSSGGDGGSGSSSGGTDGGSSSGGTACAQYGQSCASLGCCTGLACIGGVCGVVK